MMICTSSVMVKARLSDLGIRRKVERIKKIVRISLWMCKKYCQKAV